MTTDATFFLICASVGRVAELERLFESLARQTQQSFRLVLVDQNPDDRLVGLVERQRGRFALTHIRSQPRGCSPARNLGLSLLDGDIVGFPDDDCWYAPELLESAAEFFKSHPTIDVLTGMARDGAGAPVGRWDATAGPITRANVWKRGITFTMFLRTRAVQELGFFDTDLGVGSGTPFGSGEESDYLIRALDAGFCGHYEPAIVVQHPNKQYTDAGIRRAFSYGAGIGCVLRRRRCSVDQVACMLGRPLLGAALFGGTGQWRQARYQLLTFAGRVWGYGAGRDTPEAQRRRAPGGRSA